VTLYTESLPGSTHLIETATRRNTSQCNKQCGLASKSTWNLVQLIT